MTAPGGSGAAAGAVEGRRRLFVTGQLARGALERVLAGLQTGFEWRVEPLRIKVQVEDGENRGRTRVDPEGSKARVATAVRADVAHRLIADRVLSTPRRALAGAAS